jgi:hypothetical protein
LFSEREPDEQPQRDSEAERQREHEAEIDALIDEVGAMPFIEREKQRAHEAAVDAYIDEIGATPIIEREIVQRLTEEASQVDLGAGPQVLARLAEEQRQRELEADRQRVVEEVFLEDSGAAEHIERERQQDLEEQWLVEIEFAGVPASPAPPAISAMPALVQRFIAEEARLAEERRAAELAAPDPWENLDEETLEWLYELGLGA